MINTPLGGSGDKMKHIAEMLAYPVLYRGQGGKYDAITVPVLVSGACMSVTTCTCKLRGVSVQINQPHTIDDTLLSDLMGSRQQMLTMADEMFHEKGSEFTEGKKVKSLFFHLTQCTSAPPLLGEGMSGETKRSVKYSVPASSISLKLLMLMS